MAPALFRDRRSSVGSAHAPKHGTPATGRLACPPSPRPDALEHVGDPKPRGLGGSEPASVLLPSRHPSVPRGTPPGVRPAGPCRVNAALASPAEPGRGVTTPPPTGTPPPQFRCALAQPPRIAASPLPHRPALHPEAHYQPEPPRHLRPVSPRRATRPPPTGTPPRGSLPARATPSPPSRITSPSHRAPPAGTPPRGSLPTQITLVSGRYQPAERRLIVTSPRPTAARPTGTPPHAVPLRPSRASPAAAPRSRASARRTDRGCPPAPRRRHHRR